MCFQGGELILQVLEDAACTFCSFYLALDPLSRRTEITECRQSIQMFTCNKFKTKSSSIKSLLLCNYLWIVCEV